MLINVDQQRTADPSGHATGPPRDSCCRFLARAEWRIGSPNVGKTFMPGLGSLEVKRGSRVRLVSSQLRLIAIAPSHSAMPPCRKYNR